MRLSERWRMNMNGGAEHRDILLEISERTDDPGTQTLVLGFEAAARLHAELGRVLKNIAAADDKTPTPPLPPAEEPER